MNEFELKAFITNLGKYNEGELVGEWVSFPISAQELKNVYERIGIGQMNKDGRSYEEIFISDFDTNLYELRSKLTPYMNLEELNYLAGLIGELDMSGYDTYRTVLQSRLDLPENGLGGLINLTNNLNNYNIIPDVCDDEALGYYHVEENWYAQIKNLGTLADYIDYERFGEDMRLEEDGWFTDYGYITQSNYSWDKIYNQSEDIPEEYQLRFEEENKDTTALTSTYRYYITETSLMNGTYPIMDGQEITEFMEARSISESSEKIFGFIDFPMPLPEEQVREYALIPATANPFKAAEELLEDDYDMIDGIINNGEKDTKLETSSIHRKIKEKQMEVRERKTENMSDRRSVKSDQELN